MVSRNLILSKLSPFTNSVHVLVKDQTLSDIKNGLIQWHKKYSGEYDKIYPYFLGNTAKQSAQNVFDFLKENVLYKIESEDEQTLRSPAALIATGKNIGADCKNYALFSAGVLDAINRNTSQKIPLSFRFASYDLFSDTPKHVFTVAYPKGKNEIWIDPVLTGFNERKNPTSYSDKKISTMALVAMAGVNDNPQNLYYALLAELGEELQAGRVKKGDPVYKCYMQVIDKAAGKAGIASVGFVAEAQAGIAILTQIMSLFGGGNAPNPNDWQGWDSLAAKYNQVPGYFAAEWIMNDGDSVQNEAVNIKSYISNVSNGYNNVFRYHTGKVNKTVTPQDYANKLIRAGYANEAQQVLSASKPSQTMTPTGNGNTADKKNGWVLPALIGTGIYMALKK